MNLGSSPEETVRQADKFFTENSENFIWLMVTLTLAFAIIGGVSYHEAKNRFLVTLPLLRLHNRLRAVRNRTQIVEDELAVQEGRVEQFDAEFETGLMNEEAEQLRRQANPTEIEKPETESHSSRRLTPLLSLPITLIAIAILLFAFLRGNARGDEHVICLDMTKSVDVKDYSGKESEFQKSTRAIQKFIERHICPGDSIKVLGITEDSFGRPHILLNTDVSTVKGAFGEGLAREKLRLLNDWKASAPKQPVAESTDLFGAINLAAMMFSTSKQEKNLVIFSDMRQCNDDFNFERQDRLDYCRRSGNSPNWPV
jgi:hypothetical protein